MKSRRSMWFADLLKSIKYRYDKNELLGNKGSETSKNRRQTAQGTEPLIN